MRNPQTLHLLPILALASLFVQTGGLVPLRPVLTGPDKAYLGSRVAFRCIAPDAPPPLTYELMGDNDVLINTNTDPEGDQPVPFFLKVTSTSEGSYHCRAKAGGSTGVSNIIELNVVTPASNTRVTSEPFPPVAYEGSRFILSCNVTMGSHLSYTWFFNRKEVTSSSPFFHLNGNKLVIEKVAPEHAGSYYCMAWSMVQDIRRFSSSAEVWMMVKYYVSKPKISFSITKEGASYHGNVTCWSTRGSPPINISLLLDDKEVGSVTLTESLVAWFPVDMVPGRDMGEARCWVNNEVQELMSEPVTLEVVPVGGDVKLEVEYLYRADAELAAARLSCHIRRGTFPHVSWLLNDSVLPSETNMDSIGQPVLSPYALGDQRRTLFLAKLGPQESGYYHCRARDSYDDSGPWVQSPAILVRGTDGILNSISQVTSSTETLPKVPMTTVEIITISFCSFLLLMLAVSAGCVYKMFDFKQDVDDCECAPAHSGATDSDACPRSAHTSQSGRKQVYTSSTELGVQNQTLEARV